MQYVEENTELTLEWVHENNAFEKLVILYNGLKLELNQVLLAVTGNNGSVKVSDYPDPKTEGDEIVYHTLKCNVVAYIEDKKPLL